MSEGDKNVVDAIILAGGQGSRLGGRDKGLVYWQGRPLIEHVIAQIAPQVRRVIVSANRHIEDYESYGFPVCQDSREGYNGPLAGIEACISQCQSPFTLVVACDTPSLPANLVAEFLNTIQREKLSATFASDGIRSHYLPCFVRTSLLPSASCRLDDALCSMKGWLQQHNAQPTSFADATAFQNINHL